MLTQEQFDKVSRGDPLLAIGYNDRFNNREYIEAIQDNGGKLPVILLNKHGSEIINDRHRVRVEYSYKGHTDSQTVYIKHLTLMQKLPEDYKDSDILEG